MPPVPPVQTHLSQAATRKLMAVLHIAMAGDSRLLGPVAADDRIVAKVITLDLPLPGDPGAGVDGLTSPSALGAGGLLTRYGDGPP